MSIQSTPRVYFPGLNGLRFYAAMSVLIVHTGTNFGELRTQPAIYPFLNTLALDAQSAVNLFFVLSGFLITYLLLDEKERNSGISVQNFYMRRILRIWPLYYLIALLGFVLMPMVLGRDYALFDPTAHNVVLVFLLLANLVGPLGPLGHLWSISLEEQFYLVWPWVSGRHELLLKTAFGVLFVKIMLIPVIAYINIDSITHLFMSLRFECMAIGALFAYVYFTKHAVLRLIYSRAVQLVALLVVGYLILNDVPLLTTTTMIMSVAFGVLIVNIATNPHFPLKLEHPLLNRLGQISYGIYMYHFPLLYVVLFLLRNSEIAEGSEPYKAILYGMTIGGTLLLASVSYRWLEQPLLRLKGRFHGAPAQTGTSEMERQIVVPASSGGEN